MVGSLKDKFGGVRRPGLADTVSLRSDSTGAGAIIDRRWRGLAAI